MTEATTTIENPCGMHARPSSAFVRLSSFFKSKVQLKAKGKTVDAKSILMVMSMGLSKGTEVTIVADGPDEAEAIRQLIELLESSDSGEFVGKAMKFFEENTKIRAEEEARLAQIRAERLERLKQYTTTKKILENIDKVAFDQDELTDLIAGDVIQEIYLCANPFVIPLNRKNKTYVGIGKPVAIIQSNEPVDFDELGIKFKNVAFDGDYKKILRKKTPRVKKSVKATQTNTTKEVKPMAKKERFALMMEDGAQVRNIDDLKAHFDVGSVVRDFSSGKLLTWLEDRYYDDESDAIRAINDNDNFLEAKLCKIFGVETPEEIERRLQRLNRLKQFTNDEKILSKVDCVAFDQEDLADLLDEGVDEIFLYENRFVIPLRMKNKVYIGVGNAIAVIRSKEPVDFTKIHITFKNVTFDDDYQKLLPKIESSKSNSSVETFYPKSKSAYTPTNVQINGNMARVTVRYSIYSKGIVALTDKATYFHSNIKITVRDKTVDAKNYVNVIYLDLKDKDLVTITANGSDAQEAVMELKRCIEF